MDVLLLVQENLRRSFTRKADLVEKNLHSKDLERVRLQLQDLLSAYVELEKVDEKILSEMQKSDDYSSEDIQNMENSIDIFKNRWSILKTQIHQIAKELESKEEFGEAVADVLSVLATAGLITATVFGGIAYAVPALGFRSAGVAAGSMAAAYQSAVLGGTVEKGSAFSRLQSVGAGGGVSTFTKLAVVAGSVLAAAFLNKKSDEK